MPFIPRKSRTTKYVRKGYKGRRVSTKPSASFATKVKNVIKKQAETKHRIDRLTTPVLGTQVFHNSTTKLADNLLLTAQGNDDFSREGDMIQPVGVSLKFLVKQEKDRPNVNFKYWVLKFKGSATAPTGVPFKNVTGNILLDSVDSEKAQVLRTGTWKWPDNYYINPGAQYDKELTYVRKVWLPLKGRYIYSGDNSLQGRDYNIALYVSAYDTFGTLITDNICDCIVHKEFYFKDI